MSGGDTAFLTLDAPFSAWRWLQAGVYRGTFPVIPHSAAWGLILNLAGIESRGDLSEAATPIRADAPVLDVAVGAIRAAQRSVLFQQLHSYPVGNSGKELKPRARGNKYWIAPAKRELLVGLIAAVAVRGPAAILERVARGLRGEVPRYGLPFAGDNQHLFSRIEIGAGSPEARWYLPVKPGERPRESTRLTTNIDRGDASRTEAPLFAPSAPMPCPDEAWITVGPGRAKG